MTTNLDQIFILKEVIYWNKKINIEVNPLRIVHNDVNVEPQLQQVDNEQFHGLKKGNVRPDIRAKGVWGNAQRCIFWFESPKF